MPSHHKKSKEKTEAPGPVKRSPHILDQAHATIACATVQPWRAPHAHHRVNLDVTPSCTVCGARIDGAELMAAHVQAAHGYDGGPKGYRVRAARRWGDTHAASPSATGPLTSTSPVPAAAPSQPSPDDGLPPRSNRSSWSEYGLDDFSRASSRASWHSYGSRGASLDSRGPSCYAGSDRDGAESVVSVYPPSSRATSASVDPDFPFVPSRAPSEAGDDVYWPEEDARAHYDSVGEPGRCSAPMLPPGFLSDSLAANYPPYGPPQFGAHPSAPFDQPYIVLVDDEHPSQRRGPPTPEGPSHEPNLAPYYPHEAYYSGLPPVYAAQARPVPVPASADIPYPLDDPSPFAPNSLSEVALTALRRLSESQASASGAEGPQCAYRPRPHRGRSLMRTGNVGARDRNTSLPRRSRSPRSRDVSGSARRRSRGHAQPDGHSFTAAVDANESGPSLLPPDYFQSGEFDRDYQGFSSLQSLALEELQAPILQHARPMGPPQQFPGHVPADDAGPSYHRAPPSRSTSDLRAYPAERPVDVRDASLGGLSVPPRGVSWAQTSTSGSESASASRESLPLASDSNPHGAASFSRHASPSSMPVPIGGNYGGHSFHMSPDTGNAEWLPPLDATTSVMLKDWTSDNASSTVGEARTPGESSRSPTDDHTPKRPRRARADDSSPLAENGAAQDLAAHHAFDPPDDLPSFRPQWPEELRAHANLQDGATRGLCYARNLHEFEGWMLKTADRRIPREASLDTSACQNEQLAEDMRAASSGSRDAPPHDMSRNVHDAPEQDQDLHGPWIAD